jgi:hypothetical protein
MRTSCLLFTFTTVVVFGASAGAAQYPIMDKIATKMLFVAFVPFFSFKELERVFGSQQLRALFWRQRNTVSEATCGLLRREHSSGPWPVKSGK